jgi:hypothetical protein
MKHPLALLAATALASSLFAFVPVGEAHAAPVCADPTQPINTDLDTGYSIAVGTTKSQKLDLVVYTREGCDVTGATAKVTWPHGSRKVTLHKTVLPSGELKWEGRLTVSPKTLRNSDAGVWPTTFTVTGEHTDTLTVDSAVLRASRLSFNAGPEPVQNGKISYAGKLERASWNSNTYHGYSQPIEIRHYFDPHEEPDILATPSTKSNGTFRVTQKFRGAGDYSAAYSGNGSTYPKVSAEDHVED